MKTNLIVYCLIIDGFLGFLVIGELSVLFWRHEMKPLLKKLRKNLIGYKINKRQQILETN